MTKREAEYLINTHMVQPRLTEEARDAYRLLHNSSLPVEYTRGAARLYIAAVRRIKVTKYQIDPVEQGRGNLDIKAMAKVAQINAETAARYLKSFQEEGLMLVEKGTGYKGGDIFSVTPESLRSLPSVNKKASKSTAVRCKEYRDRKKAEVEALKAQVAALQVSR